MVLNFNRDIHICDMDIEKIDSTYFKVTIKLSDGKIIANKVNFGNATMRQEQEEDRIYNAERGTEYFLARDVYKIFLEGICCKDDNGVAINVTAKL